METKEELARDYAAEIAEAPERLKFAQGLAQAGLQSLTLVNGGALIALFTVIGAGKIVIDMSWAWYAFAAFAVGIIAAQAGFLFGFFSQDQFYKLSAHTAWNISAEMAGKSGLNDVAGPRQRGSLALAAAIGSAVVALAGFVVGAGFALASVT